MRTLYSNFALPRSPYIRTVHSGSQFSYKFHYFSGDFIDINRNFIKSYIGFYF